MELSLDAVPAGKILFREGDRILADADGDLLFWDGSLAYVVGSHPYDPCVCLLRDGTPFVVLRNAFTADEIRRLAESGGTTTSITGNVYDAGRICRLLAFAAANCPVCDFDYAEGRIAVEDMKAMGATAPETAVPIQTLGVRCIPDALSRSKKLAERVMYTEDGRVYVRIKR